MDSNLLDDIYKFHYTYNNKTKIFKYKNLKILYPFILLILISFLTPFILLNYINKFNITTNITISEIFTFISLMMYIFTSFKNKIDNDLKCFIKYINSNTKIKIDKLEDFQKYNLLLYMYEKSEFNLNKHHFDYLYELIDLYIERYTSYDYLSPKKLLIYTAIISLLVALLTSIFENMPIEILFIILIAFIFVLIIYFFCKPILDNPIYKQKNNFYKLKEVLKKCEIDFYYNESLKNSLSLNSVLEFKNIIENFNVKNIK